MSGLIVQPTAPDQDATAVFVVLERFHLAIALVTVVPSSLFLLALMVMLVDERRETVAILRLIGLARGRILLQVLAEGLLIALAGAAFGASRWPRSSRAASIASSRPTTTRRSSLSRSRRPSPHARCRSPSRSASWPASPRPGGCFARGILSLARR